MDMALLTREKRKKLREEAEERRRQREPMCRHGGHALATGLYYIPEGCICFADKIQFLCPQHALKAEQNGIKMTKIADLGGARMPAPSDEG